MKFKLTNFNKIVLGVKNKIICFNIGIMKEQNFFVIFNKFRNSEILDMVIKLGILLSLIIIRENKFCYLYSFVIR